MIKISDRNTLRTERNLQDKWFLSTYLEDRLQGITCKTQFYGGERYGK